MKSDYKSAEARISKRLRETRIAKGMTQTKLAALAGTNQTVIQNIENGASVRPRCLAGLADALEVNPAWLAWGEPYAFSAALSDENSRVYQTVMIDTCNQN